MRFTQGPSPSRPTPPGREPGAGRSPAPRRFFSWMQRLAVLGLASMLLGVLPACGGGSGGSAAPAPVPVTGVQLSSNSLDLTGGEAAATLTATVQPADASNPAVTWSSSNTSVATVSAGAVTPVASGSATIMVTTVDGGKTATCAVTVTVHVTGVQLDTPTLGVVMGTPQTLTATVTPAGATNPAVTWYSANTSIATVVNGVVTPVAPGGPINITATTVNGSFVATCAVTVTAPVVPVTGVQLNQGSLTFSNGGTGSTLIATVVPANATNRAVTWSSSTPGVATVVGGAVTPVATGATTITVTTVSGGFTATCPVTVNGPVFGTIYEFGGPLSPANDGAEPKGTLTPVQISGSTVLFGRTAIGGNGNCGIIFSINPDGSDYQVLYRFDGTDGCNPRHDAMTFDTTTGLLYGTTEGDNQVTGATYGNNGQIFSFLPGSPITPPITAIHTFANPSPASAPFDGAQQHSCFIIDPISGVLYGESGAGGANNLGMLYSVAPDGTNFTDLHDFGTTGGNNPHGSPILLNGILYGIDRTGGSANFGTVYACQLSNGQYSALHTFVGGVSDGATSDHGNLTPVTISGKTILFGMTQYGGTGTGVDNGGAGNGGGCGIIFQIDPTAAPGTSAAFNIAYSFQGTEKFDGAWPYGSLLYDGTYLYGTTSAGGAYNKGTIFRLAPPAFGATATPQVLYHLGTLANDGTKPIDNVIKVGNTLYGLSVYGGAITVGNATGNGAVFVVPLP